MHPGRTRRHRAPELLKRTLSVVEKYVLSRSVKPSLLIVFCWFNIAVESRASEAIDFRRDIAPIFQQHCLRCHNPGKSEGELSLASRADLIESEQIVVGEPDESPLLDAITAEAGEKPAMPKEGKPLTDAQVTLIRRWISTGAQWPEGLVIRETSKADKTWWSFQPLKKVPPVATGNPIDGFVSAKLAEKGLTLNPPADRRTLIRRATYDLTGLPPTPQEVAAFLKDDSPQAYDHLIDRLLASPHYGERWGRHWLDVIRFGESNGYERNVLINNLWPFRDYIIQSFNQDKPFDELVLEHLAGDVVGAGEKDVEIGTAFLVCGPFDDVGNQDAVQAAQIRANVIDEIIRVTSEAFLGLTLGCARCHDHKFDPLLQEDYYGLYSTFAGTHHGSRIVAKADAIQNYETKRKPLDEAVANITQQRQQLLDTIAERAEAKREQFESSWVRASVNHRGTEDRFAPVLAKQIRLTVESVDTDPNRNTGFHLDEFEVWTADETPRNVARAKNGGSATGASRIAEDFADAYSASLTIDDRFDVHWIATGNELTITFAQPEQIDRVFFSSDRERPGSSPRKSTFVGEYRLETSLDGKTWTVVSDSSNRKPPSDSHHRRRLIEAEITEAERQKSANIEMELTIAKRERSALQPLTSWWAGQFRKAPGPFHLFRGGDPQKKGDEVRPASLRVLKGSASEYQLESNSPESERRLALARWIVSRDNPLTARVLANRLWHYHFGTGIVDTPSDFGYMGGRPTHPELLDWLAGQVHELDWKLKPLHRLMMTSATYRQSSDFDRAASKIDADARLLWRFPPRRLSAEEIRDSILSVAGRLDKKMGGPGFRLYRYLQDNVATYIPLEHHGPETYRRAVYHQTARAAPVDLMGEFDSPDCAFSTPRRSSTTTPLQALTMLNHSFTLDMAVELADRLEREAGDEVDQQVRLAFELCYCREPTEVETTLCTNVISDHGLRAFCRVLLNTSELVYVK